MYGSVSNSSTLLARFVTSISFSKDSPMGRFFCPRSDKVCSDIVVTTSEGISLGLPGEQVRKSTTRKKGQK